MSNVYRRGENVFLYVQFKDDDGNSISVLSPEFKIISERDLEPVLEAELLPIDEEDENNSEYYSNYIIPYDSKYGNYEVVYKAEYQDKVARVMENFRVIPKSNIYENTVKVYGKVNQENNSLCIPDVFVDIYSSDEKDIVYQTRTNMDGYWEVQIYPGKYKISFDKIGYFDVKYDIQIGNEHNEIQFNNVVMELDKKNNSGNGIYRINEKHITKEGMEIFGLNIKAYNVSNIREIVAENTTDKNGVWELFLDPGVYMLKIDGDFYGTKYNEKFRLKVFDDGNFSFESLSKNIATATVEEEYISPGDVSNINNIEVTDTVIDADGYPIVDVQVNVFRKEDLNTILVQDYTDLSGTWKVYLPEGNYVFEFYHPNFDVVTKEEKIFK